MRAIDVAGAAEAAITNANVAQHDALVAYRCAAMKGGPSSPASTCVLTCCPSPMPLACCCSDVAIDASDSQSICRAPLDSSSNKRMGVWHHLDAYICIGGPSPSPFSLSSEHVSVRGIGDAAKMDLSRLLSNLPVCLGVAHLKLGSKAAGKWGGDPASLLKASWYVWHARVCTLLRAVDRWHFPEVVRADMAQARNGGSKGRVLGGGEGHSGGDG